MGAIICCAVVVAVSLVAVSLIGVVAFAVSGNVLHYCNEWGIINRLSISY